MKKLPLIVFFFFLFGMSYGQPKQQIDTVKIKLLVSNLLNQVSVMDGYEVTVKEWRNSYVWQMTLYDAGYYPIKTYYLRSDKSLLPSNITIWQIKQP